jgi:hypothetical protein
MVERFEADVFEERPSLVVWQTGLNDVVAGVNVDDFRQTLLDGVQQLKGEGIDVILMDLQYYPNSKQFEDYDHYLRTMQAVADETGVSVFNRFASMKYLLKDLKRRSGGGLMSSNLFAIMDLNYRCLPVLLADAIFEKLHEAMLASGSSTPPDSRKR